MRIFAVSDIHVDFAVNREWVSGIPVDAHQDDILILAGDISDSLGLLEWCFEALAHRFKTVLYVPGNHDLWVLRDKPDIASLDKLERIRHVARKYNVSMEPVHLGKLSIVPLFGWYDYSFGAPDSELMAVWMDYRACHWPENWSAPMIARHFQSLNHNLRELHNDMTISFSHFLPRRELLPPYSASHALSLGPVLGSRLLEGEIRKVGSDIHVYGHSHFNRKVSLEGVLYINNAFGYPYEEKICRKRLLCIYES